MKSELLQLFQLLLPVLVALELVLNHFLRQNLHQRGNYHLEHLHLLFRNHLLERLFSQIIHLPVLVALELVPLHLVDRLRVQNQGLVLIRHQRIQGMLNLSY